ncbi:MAG TPA: hypothetical protein PKE45_10330, partial [Caldilineaceae bacterium]|nr:hypothetical protein [Caldilineaceae bacterium]
MAKQRTLEFENDVDLDMEMEGDLDAGFEAEIETLEADTPNGAHHLTDEAELVERPPMTPEAALEHLITLGRT